MGGRRDEREVGGREEGGGGNRGREKGGRGRERGGERRLLKTFNRLCVQTNVGLIVNVLDGRVTLDEFAKLLERPTNKGS